MLQYKILSKSEVGKWADELSDFYKKYYDEAYSSVFENTDFVSICVENKKIIGAIRVISDLKRFALLVDLRVDERYQKQGIATNIMKRMLIKLKEMNIAHINLLVTKKTTWLKQFYTDMGFVEIIDSDFLEYR
jgi:N-acetylglutamate synthase-like GNAT family acetyltransferase